MQLNHKAHSNQLQAITVDQMTTVCVLLNVLYSDKPAVAIVYSHWAKLMVWSFPHPHDKVSCDKLQIDSNDEASPEYDGNIVFVLNLAILFVLINKIPKQ